MTAELKLFGTKMSLEAREILNHLNHLGYRNVSAEQLKEFQKDLRKLIKFDTRLTTSEDQKHSDANTPPETVFERLHSEKTVSYQAKVAQTNKKGSLSGISDKENHPAPKLAPHTNNNKPNKMWIRPKSSQSARRGDPVALYHAYQKDWNRFKQKLPGENNHSELRWKIRTKLLGE
uniref:Centriolar and ciliogenesis-associated protein HYLS1 C-terminal domain-containing protein n=1 Tax=Anopheles atroparvus TaxID=41427 RepID=A0AAG5CVZ0_ANOAO